MKKPSLPNQIYLRVHYNVNNAFGNCKLAVTAWYDAKAKRMIDDHITDLYPALNTIPLYDLMEGHMEYDDVFDKAQLEDELRKLGFNVI